MRALIKRMLFLLVALAASAPSIADARCRPQALIAGDRELVEALRRELDEGGLVRTQGKPDPQCFALSVRVQRRGSSLWLVASEPSGVPMEREASSTAIAATVIEAWALRGTEGMEGQTIAEAGPAKFFVRPMLGTARSTDEQQFYLASIAIGLGAASGFEFSLEGYYGRGPENFFDGHPGVHEGGLLFSAAYDFSFGNLTISPELSFGAGIGSINSSAFVDFTQAGLRERLALRFSYAMSSVARAEALIFGHLMSDAERVFSDASLGRLAGFEDGILMFGLSFGLRYSP
jgi:hypothetical protein